MNASALLSLQILSPEGSILEVKDAQSIIVPLVDGGSIGIRPGHAPLIAETVRGEVRYRTNDKEHQIEVMPGILKINKNIVTILTAHKVKEEQAESSHPITDDFSEMVERISQEIPSLENNPGN